MQARLKRLRTDLLAVLAWGCTLLEDSLRLAEAAMINMSGVMMRAQN